MLVNPRFRAAILLAIAGFIVAMLVHFWSSIILSVVHWQHVFHQLLSDHIRQFHTQPFYYGSLLIALSLAYGVFHAAGPGHGKAVLITYLSTQKETARQGIAISFSAALLQSVVAIVLVSVVSILLNATFKKTNLLGNQVEQVSYLLVSLVGLFLFIRSLLLLIRSRRTKNHPHDHSEHAHNDHKCDEGCNHVYAAKPPKSIWQALAVVFSMGMRPCSGAVVVLIYANVVGVYWVGIVSTLMMGAGTGLTIACLGWLSIVARDYLLTIFPTDAEHVHHSHTVSSLLGAIGGGVLVLLGWSLFEASRQILGTHPLF